MIARLVILVLWLTLTAGDAYGSRVSMRDRLANKVAQSLGEQGKLRAGRLVAGLVALVIACGGLACNSSPSPLQSRHDDKHDHDKGGKYGPGDTVLYETEINGAIEISRGEVIEKHRYFVEVIRANERMYYGSMPRGYYNTYARILQDSDEVVAYDYMIRGRRISDPDERGEHIDIDSDREGVMRRHALILDKYRYVRPRVVKLRISDSGRNIFETYNIEYDKNEKLSSKFFYAVRVTHETLTDGTLIDLDKSYVDYVFENGRVLASYDEIYEPYDL